MNTTKRSKDLERSRLRKDVQTFVCRPKSRRTTYRATVTRKCQKMFWNFHQYKTKQNPQWILLFVRCKVSLRDGTYTCFVGCPLYRPYYGSARIFFFHGAFTSTVPDQAVDFNSSNDATRRSATASSLSMTRVLPRVRVSRHISVCCAQAVVPCIG